MKKFFLSFVVLVTLGAAAQKVSGKLSFQKGQKLEVTTSQNVSAETPMGENKSNSVSVAVYEVKDVTPAGTTLELSTKRIKLSFSMMGQDRSIDSDNPEDLKGMMGEPVKELLAKKTEFTIDANGVITAVKQDESKKSSDNGMAAMFMQQMNMAAAVFKPGANSPFKVLPTREVGKGDTWTDSLSANDVRSNMVYTVKEITASDVVLDFTTDGVINTTNQAMGMSMDVKGTVKGTGTILLDKATGLPKQNTSTVVTEATTNMGGQDINIKSKIAAATTMKVL